MSVWTAVATLGLALLLAMFVSGVAGLNIVAAFGVLIWWLVAPAWGAWLFTAWWVMLVGLRLLQVRRWGSERLSRAFPVSVAEQNRTSALLILVGLAGAVRSLVAGEKASIVLAVLGAVVCFMVQAPLFRLSARGLQERPAADAAQDEA